jgi:DNA (cytosine-5)-methyltransferase 1
MSKLKVLNLYSGIGGNRELWDNVEVTAVEYDLEISKIYQELFPDDIVVVDDAHRYLLENFDKFDFIWSSPSCPTHSRIRKLCSYRVNSKGERYCQNKPVYPDMQLYGEVIFLQNYFKGKWVVENVISYYDPLIHPKMLQRHYFWSNVELYERKYGSDNIQHIGKEEIDDFNNSHSIDLRNFKVDRVKVIRNRVKPELGLYILNCVKKELCIV